MKSTLNCIPCLVRQAVSLSKIVFEEDSQREAWVKETLHDLSQRDFLNTTPPELTQKVFQDLLKRGGLHDPYKEIKSYYNKEILKLEDRLQGDIERAENPLTRAMVLAIAGNIIDFGTPGGVDREKVFRIIEETESKELARDDSPELFRRMGNIENLLYLGDNCGEIVFDKLFISQIQKAFPHLNITYAVRGSAILNDVTMDDALETGISELVETISNGDNAPGTRLEHCSQEFQDHYGQADLIISKGQGNFETLDERTDKEIFFLFMTKCPVISEKTGVAMHSLMCIKNSHSPVPV